MHGVLLPPCDFAPQVLKVNSSFNEQKINSMTGYAQPDNYDESLTIASGPNAGQLATTNLNQHFFGIKPGILPNSFYQNATVTITKLDKIDPESDQTERGTIRLYAIQNFGQSGAQSFPIPISTPGQTLKRVKRGQLMVLIYLWGRAKDWVWRGNCDWNIPGRYIM